jgi:hypothetical protein
MPEGIPPGVGEAPLSPEGEAGVSPFAPGLQDMYVQKADGTLHGEDSCAKKLGIFLICRTKESRKASVYTRMSMESWTDNSNLPIGRAGGLRSNGLPFFYS